MVLDDDAAGTVSFLLLTCVVGGTTCEQNNETRTTLFDIVN